MPRALCSVVSFYLINSGNLSQENNLKKKSCGKEFALVLITSSELNLRAPQIMNKKRTDKDTSIYPPVSRVSVAVEMMVMKIQ